MALQILHHSRHPLFLVSTTKPISLFLCFCLVQLLLSGDPHHHDPSSPSQSSAPLPPHPRWRLIALASADSGPPVVRPCAGVTDKTSDFLTLNDPTAKCAHKLTIPIDIHDSAGVNQEQEFWYKTAVGPGGMYDIFSYKELTVRVTRRDVIVRHDMSYLKEFNAKPYETPVPDSNCNNEFNPNVATCGLALNSDGSFALFSQGFCCDCTTCYDGSCDASWRANACSSRTTKVAACLRMSALYYDGYSLETPPKLSYVMDVRIWGTLADYITTSVFTTRPLNTSVTISPDALQVYNSTDAVIVMFENRTVNQGLRGARVANITGKVLFIPSRPVSNSIVTAGASEWMFLDPKDVAVDGIGCDKVGTSYRAFAMQFNGCNLDVGTCLNGQLQDLRTSDRVVMAGGFPGNFMAPNYGSNFSAHALPGSTRASYTAYPAHVTPEPTTINIILDRAHLLQQLLSLTGSIRDVGIAQLKDVNVPVSYAIGTARNAGSSSSSPYDKETGIVYGGIFVEVGNDAINAAHYHVIFDGCTDSIDQESIPILWGTANPYSRVTITPPIKSRKGAPINTYASCTAHVYDLNEREVDSRSVRWAITERGFQANLLPNETTSTATPSTGGSSGNGYGFRTGSCEGCDFFSVERNFQQGCAKLIAANTIALIAAIAAGCGLASLVVWWLSCWYAETDRDAADGKTAQRAQPQATKASHTQAPAATAPAPAVAQRVCSPPGQDLSPLLPLAAARPASVRLAPPLSPAQLYADPVAQLLQLQQEQTEYLYYYYEPEPQSRRGSVPLSHSPYGNPNSGMGSYTPHYGIAATTAAPPTTRASPRRTTGRALVEEVSDRDSPSPYARSPAQFRVEDVTPLPYQHGARPNATIAPAATRNRPRRTLNDIDGDSDVENACPITRRTSALREPFAHD